MNVFNERQSDVKSLAEEVFKECGVMNVLNELGGLAGSLVVQPVSMITAAAQQKVLLTR